MDRAAVEQPRFAHVGTCAVWRPDAAIHVPLWLDALNGNRVMTEAYVNHLHVRDLFVASSLDEHVKAHGLHLVRLWRAALARDLGRLTVVVEFNDDPEAMLLTAFTAV